MATADAARFTGLERTSSRIMLLAGLASIAGGMLLTDDRRLAPRIVAAWVAAFVVLKLVLAALAFRSRARVWPALIAEALAFTSVGLVVVLGGLIEEKVEGSVSMVPGLGRLPIVGNLFRYDTRKRVKTNLLVFLRPVVLRTFMADAGTHAILVGFPAGVHVAYDGRDCRPALTWKGRFFDAYGTWFSRFAPFEKPLGESVVAWPAPSDAADTRKFEGYRLDAAGVPTFLFSVGGVPVAERFEPAENGSLRRTLTWNLESLRSLPLAHPPGLTVQASPASTPGKLEFIYTWP